MNRRLLVIGILALALGCLSAYESGQQFLTTLSGSNNTVTSEAFLGANMTGYLPTTLGSASFFEMAYNSTNALNVYMLNSSAFNVAYPYLNISNALAAKAVSLEGNGTIMIFTGQSRGVFPYQASYGSIFPPPNYTSINASVLPAGIYYTIFSNPNPSNTVVFYSIYNKPETALGLTNGNTFGFGIVSGILLLGGFALIIYSIFFRSASTPDQKVTEERVQKLYTEIAGKETRHARKARKPAHKAKRRRARR